MLKILIPEKIPAHNKGEEAIFRGILKTLDFISEKKIYLYSKSPDYDKSRYKDAVELITESLIPDSEISKAQKLVHIFKYLPLHLVYAFIYRINKDLTKRIFKGDLWNVYYEMDIVLAAHDNAYSIMHNLLIIFCKVINKPIVIYGAGIKPFLYKRTWVRKLSKICLNMADLITVREEITQNVLVEKVGLKKNLVRLTADKAFLLEPIEKLNAIKLLEKHGIFYGKEKIVGMTVVYKTGILNQVKTEIKKHINTIATLVDFISGEIKAKVVFFPHSIGPDEANDDRIAAKMIFDRCKHKDNIRLIVEDFSAGELKGMIGCCDFFIGERVHSIIAAASMNVPSISISHPEDYRAIGILGLMVGMKNRIYNIKEIDISSLKQFFLDAWNHRDEIKKFLSKRIPEVIKGSRKNGEYLQMIINSQRY